MNLTPGLPPVFASALAFAAAALVGSLAGCASGGLEGEGSGSSGPDFMTGTGSETAGSETGMAGTDTQPETTQSEATDSDSDTDEACELTDCAGECVDLDSSAAHCGSCSFDCLGGECVDGECQTAVLATNKGRLWMVEVDDEHVYYGGDGVFVGRIGLDGSEDTTLDAGTEVCEASTVTSSALLWGGAESMGLRGCITPDCPGGVVQFYDGVGVLAMAYSELYSRLFWAQGGAVLTREWPGGELETFVSGQGQVLELETSATHLYWLAVNQNDSRFVRRVDLLGESPVETLVGPRPDITGFTAGPARVYWSEAQLVYSLPYDEAPLQGEPALFNQAQAPLRDLLADDEHVYWVAAQGDGIGYVERCELGQCPVPKRLDEPQRPWSLAIGELAVYWVTETGVVAGRRK